MVCYCRAKNRKTGVCFCGVEPYWVGQVRAMEDRGGATVTHYSLIAYEIITINADLKEIKLAVSDLQ